MFEKKIDNELSLVLLYSSHAEGHLKIRNDNLSFFSKRMPFFKTYNSKDMFSKWIENSLINFAKEKSLFFSIMFDNKIIGCIGFSQINLNIEKVELGFWLCQKYQKRGIIHKSCLFLINYAFREYHATKIEIRTDETNAECRAVCAKLNMKLEGIITNAYKVDGQLVSEAIYALHKN